MKALINFFIVWLIALTLLGLNVLSLSMVNAVGQKLPSVVPLMAESEPYKLIDNFDTETSRPCSKENGAEISELCPISYSLGNSYVVMTYDVTKKTNPAQPSSAWLPKDLGNMDLSAWDSVWIIIKGKNGGEKLYAEFTECGDLIHQKLEINSYIFGGITNTWRAAFILFSEFNQITDWSCIQQFSIIAHSDISGKGEVYVDDIRLLPAKVVIDDFNDSMLLENELKGVAGSWCNPYLSSCTSIIKSGLAADSLRLKYNLNSPSTIGAGYSSTLLSAQLFSRKNNLFLDVYNEQGNQKIWVELKDCGAIHAPEIQINDYLDDGITTTWQTVAIPLAAFVDVKDGANTRTNWNCIDQLSLNLASNHSGMKMEDVQGIVYIDNILLAPLSSQTSRIPVIVDNFNDCDTWNALGWEWHTDGELTFKFSSSTNQSGNYGCSYKLTYNVTFEQSGSTWADLKGLDLTGYDDLQFFVRGTTGSEVMNVCLKDRQSSLPACQPVAITTTNTWQPVRKPLSAFNSPNIHLADLENLKFVFEKRIEHSDVYVDSISFIQLKSLWLPIILKDYPPTELYVSNDNTGGELTFFVRNLTTKVNIIPPCGVPNKETKYCGSFPAGKYEIQAFTLCTGPNPPDTRFYEGGPQTTRVFCKPS